MKRTAALCAFAFAFAAVAILSARPAAAGPASIAFNITGGSAVLFTSGNNTSSSLAAGAPLTGTVTVTTKNGGGGQVWINSPANPIGAGGATLNLALITVTCIDTGASGWFHNGSATLVPGGSSATCATIDPKINNQTTTMQITFTIDARTLIADTWSATGGFSLGGSAF